jgi:hypothetical protein
MLKPFAFSLSLALALGFSSVSMAGGLDSSCTTCGLASPQGVVASGQGASYGGGCDSCSPAPKHKFCFSLPKLPHISLPKINHSVSYEWVLKKKHNFSLSHKAPAAGCGTPGCGEPVYATGQGGIAPSGQGAIAPTGQGSYTPTTYPAPQVFGAGQHAFQAAKPAPAIASVPAEMTSTGEEAPPAPEVKGSNGLLLPTPSGN